MNIRPLIEAAELLDEAALATFEPKERENIEDIGYQIRMLLRKRGIWIGSPRSTKRTRHSRTIRSVARGCVQRGVGPLVVDGWEFDAPLDAALHLLWLLQRLSYYEKHREGQPCDGFRFREGIIATRKLLRKLKYEPGELKRPNEKGQR